MANITTQTIRVDLSTDKVLPTAFTHQNDTARTLEFSMYNKGMPYTMTGNTVKFAYKSPVVDGAYTVITGSGMASGTVSGNKVSVTLPVAYTQISGVGMLTMIITPTSGTVRPVNIRLVVQKSADGDDTVAGASDMPDYLAEVAEQYYSQYITQEIAGIKSELQEDLTSGLSRYYSETQIILSISDENDNSITDENGNTIAVPEYKFIPKGGLKQEFDFLKKWSANYSIFAHNKFVAHNWVNESTSENTTSFYIPSQSIYDIEMTARLGYAMIEGNVHATATDGKYVVMHGNGGKLGNQVVSITNGYATTSKFTDLSYDEIRNNFVYRNVYEKYKTPITSLEEFCYACKKFGLIPLLTYVDDVEWGIITSILGENVIGYNAPRQVFGGIISEYLSYTTKSEIIEHCQSIGAPYSYSIANPTSFSDVDLKEIVNAIHVNGCVCSVAGVYLSPNNERKYLEIGVDSSGSGYSVEDFHNGNVLHLVADNDYSDFDTNGNYTDGVLTLNSGQYIRRINTETNFLQKASLHITFNGTVTFSMGDYINNISVTSDGISDVWFSTLFLNRNGDFTITATDTTKIKSITYDLSVC